MTLENISVIISVYNRFDYLKNALISIQHQSVVPAEVVVTDDGSQEPIESFLKELTGHFSFSLKLVRQADKGFRLARCKNNGVRAASHDFLVFWDQDVMGTHGYLETYVKNRQSNTFLVAYPVRLTEEQTRQLNDDDIKKGTFDHLLKKEQIEKIHRQYRKDRFYYYLRKFILRNDTRPKLRGGVFAVSKSDLIRVNGFDENYQGWGNEDDDLGRRLYASGVVGFNPFYHEFPLHLFHLPYHQNGKRVNDDYYRQRQNEIRQGAFWAAHGIKNTLGDDLMQILEMK